MKNSIHYFFLFFLVLILYVSIGGGDVVASDLTSASFIIRDPVIGAGGGYGTSATFQLFSSEDTLFTGLGTSAGFIGEYGFLYFPAEISPSPTPTPGGGGGGGVIYVGVCRIADFNCDNYVNIFDLSILLYYVERSGPEIAPYDLSKDNLVDFVDTSIMFYYWDV